MSKRFSINNNQNVQPSIGQNHIQVFNVLKKEVSIDVFSAIKKYAEEFGIDYRLVLAVVKNESQFNAEAISVRGAEGLMQLMPFTHSEIKEELFGQDSINGNNNLRNGIYYLSKLLELFNCNSYYDQVSLALAAYNAGPSRIYDAQELAAYLGENPKDWSVIEKTIPLLSKRYYSLHQMVWGEGRPPSGFFGGWRETLAYVENVLKTYREFREII
jgi:membrane-bound lytic murein transglycosylase F